ncbi:MAG: nickel insertion protein, partial [Chloroflexota bacterium]
MTRIAYLDCFAGISGDMLLGALLDAGLDLDALRAELARLGVDGWSLRAERVKRSGLAATRAHVDLAESPQPHRRLPDILALIERSTLDAGDKQRASSVFQRLADAEARVHGVEREAIDFHEVGALDAIVDIVGGVAGLRLLGIERLYCSALPAGGGTARSSHGALPVPAPATLELIA